MTSTNMKLTREQTQTIIDAGKAQGLNGQDVLNSLIKKGYQPEGVETSQIQKPAGVGALDVVKEAGEDLLGIGKDIYKSSSKRAENMGESDRAFRSGEQGLIATAFQKAGQKAGAGADAIGAVFKGGANFFLSDKTEKKITAGLGDVAQKALEIPEVQSMVTKYEALSPKQKRTVDAGGGIVALISEFLGGGIANKGVTASKRAVGSIDNAIGQASKEWDSFMASKTSDVTTTPGKPAVSIEDALKSPEYGITKEIAGIKNIGDQSKFLTVPEKRKLLDIDPDKGNEYIDTLIKSEDSFDNMTPFEKAVIDVEDVVNKYDSFVSDKGSEIGAIKQKLASQKVNKADIDNIISDVIKNLKAKGVSLKNGKFEITRGSNSPFSAQDIKALNSEITDTLKNINKSSSMEQLLLGMERLDNKINFNTVESLTNSLQGVSKNVRAKLKSLRDKALSPEESKVFEDFSGAKAFIDDFKKGNSENKIMALLNTVGTKRDIKIKRIADEIKRITGEDITDYAYLARILSESAGSQSRNRSLLNQYIGEVASFSPAGVGMRAIEGIANKIINVDKLDEVRKAINFRKPQ